MMRTDFNYAVDQLVPLFIWSQWSVDSVQ